VLFGLAPITCQPSPAVKPRATRAGDEERGCARRPGQVADLLRRARWRGLPDSGSHV